MTSNRETSVSHYLRIVRWCSLLVFILPLAGCILIEPYPASTVEDISQSDVPKRVLKAFGQEHAGSAVIRIEKEVLHSRLTGYPTWYRFTFTSPDGCTDQVVLDKRGRLSTGGPDFSREKEDVQAPADSADPTN